MIPEIILKKIYLYKWIKDQKEICQEYKKKFYYFESCGVLYEIISDESTDKPCLKDRTIYIPTSIYDGLK